MLPTWQGLSLPTRVCLGSADPNPQLQRWRQECAGAGNQLSITSQRDNGPFAPTDLGLASDSSLQLAFDHLPLPCSLLGDAGELS